MIKLSSEQKKMFRPLIFLLAFAFLVSIYVAWNRYSSMQKRIELTQHYRLGYAKLYKSFAVFDSCFSGQFYLFASETDWLACDLKALRHAHRWNFGVDYLRYMVERDKAFTDTGFRMYVLLKTSHLCRQSNFYSMSRHI